MKGVEFEMQKMPESILSFFFFFFSESVKIFFFANNPSFDKQGVKMNTRESVNLYHVLLSLQRTYYVGFRIVSMKIVLYVTFELLSAVYFSIHHK